jgi:acyl-CoA synthetase (AMP-forming)/AMP-acid ligase II
MGAGCAIVARTMALGPGDVVYSDLSHQVLAALLGGATVVMPARGGGARRFVADVRRHGVTHTYAVPFEMAEVVAELERRGEKLPEHLRCIVLGSAPIHRAFLERLRRVIAERTDVWCVYAMSEMLPVTLVESREKLAFEGEGDLVGTPVAGAEVSLADDHELLVRGPNLCRRYVGQAPITRHRTGDLARIDDRGRVVLLGRKKDMIIRGHHNLYPALYEETFAAIEGVEACALVGIDNADHTDEEVVLAVQPAEGVDPQRLVARVREALEDGRCDVDVFARPDHVVACELPYAGRSMKLDRLSLRETLAASLGRSRDA